MNLNLSILPLAAEAIQVPERFGDIISFAIITVLAGCSITSMVKIGNGFKHHSLNRARAGRCTECGAEGLPRAVVKRRSQLGPEGAECSADSQVRPSRLIVFTEPRHEAPQPLFQRNLGLEPDRGVDAIDTRVSFRHVARLGGEQLDVGFLA